MTVWSERQAKRMAMLFSKVLFEWPSMRTFCRRYYSGARDPPGRVAGEFSVFPVANSR
jgi:hypothetical protein